MLPTVRLHISHVAEHRYAACIYIYIYICMHVFMHACGIRVCFELMKHPECESLHILQVVPWESAVSEVQVLLFTVLCLACISNISASLQFRNTDISSASMGCGPSGFEHLYHSGVPFIAATSARWRIIIIIIIIITIIITIIYCVCSPWSRISVSFPFLRLQVRSSWFSFGRRT